MGAEFKKYPEPDGKNDVLKTFKPRLPRFLFPETVEKMGFDPEIISTMHPMATPIAYPDTDIKNLEDKSWFESKNPGRRHIPSYMEASYRVKTEANPSGSKKLEQVHPEKKSFSNWYAAPRELEQYINHVHLQSISTKILEILDLAVAPNYASQASLKPAKETRDTTTGREPTHAMVEISFNRVGIQQVRIPNKMMRYSNVVPIEYINRHFKLGGL